MGRKTEEKPVGGWSMEGWWKSGCEVVGRGDGVASGEERKKEGRRSVGETMWLAPS